MGSPRDVQGAKLLVSFNIVSHSPRPLPMDELQVCRLPRAAPGRKRVWMQRRVGTRSHAAPTASSDEGTPTGTPSGSDGRTAEGGGERGGRGKRDPRPLHKGGRRRRSLRFAGLDQPARARMASSNQHPRTDQAVLPPNRCSANPVPPPRAPAQARQVSQEVRVLRHTNKWRRKCLPSARHQADNTRAFCFTMLWLQGPPSVTDIQALTSRVPSHPASSFRQFTMTRSQSTLDMVPAFQSKPRSKNVRGGIPGAEYDPNWPTFGRS